MFKEALEAKKQRLITQRETGVNKEGMKANKMSKQAMGELLRMGKKRHVLEEEMVSLDLRNCYFPISVTCTLEKESAYSHLREVLCGEIHFLLY